MAEWWDSASLCTSPPESLSAPTLNNTISCDAELSGVAVGELDDAGCRHQGSMQTDQSARDHCGAGHR
jgi:hypothetical protein